VTEWRKNLGRNQAQKPVLLWPTNEHGVISENTSLQMGLSIMAPGINGFI